MFIIKGIHAESFSDKKGQMSLRLNLTTKIPFMQKERVVSNSAFSYKNSICKVVEIVNEHISPVVKDFRVLSITDIEEVYEKIQSIDKAFFTEDKLGVALFTEVKSLIKDMFRQDLLLASATM